MRRFLARSVLLAWGVACSGLGPSTALMAQSHERRAEAHRPAASIAKFHWSTAPGQPLSIEVHPAGNADWLQSVKDATLSPADWQRVLAVRPVSSSGTTEASVSMVGSYRVTPKGLRFDARFEAFPGLTYEAVFNLANFPGASYRGAPISSQHSTAVRRIPAHTQVRQVYPSADVLPENLLKFYIVFSGPMSRGNIYQHIHLRKAGGEEVELPFLEIHEELWDPTLCRLTLFIDPGRIKRGVKPLEEIGAALESGKSYTLEIDRAWQDADGAPLTRGFRKRFHVSPTDRESPEFSRWELEIPAPGTRRPLGVRLSEPLDHALAQRLIFVRDREGKQVEGGVRLSDQERHWAFIPKHPWTRGDFELVVETTIEDLAGNNLDKVFDVDVFERVRPRMTAREATRPFTIR